MPTFVGRRKVRFSREEVAEFNRTWPCSKLRDRSYWFEFDNYGDLVDTDVPEQDDGDAATAMANEAQEWIAEQNATDYGE